MGGLQLPSFFTILVYFPLSTEPNLSMKQWLFISAGIVLILTVAWFTSSSFQQDKISYNQHIRPILNKNCLSCHGGVKKESGFSLLFEEEAKSANESGKLAIVPGDAKHSEMIRRITSNDPDIRMPPEGDPLSEEEINLIKKWISQGAEWETHWALIKPEKQQLPEANPANWPQNDIDHFILAGLKENKLKPSPEAESHFLIRRLYLDLTGLPPSPEEVRQITKNFNREKYQEKVDSLLSSPHFGEKWASLWLDLARFADSKGYEKDGFRNIWKFRDYVIKSFNEDKPYDQFTIEQLAGDLLPNPTEEQLIATAFHRNTMNNDEGGTDDEEFRVAAVIDRVNTTFEVWQGLTMSCVQCHSHPYDPFRHEEYYQLMAFFNNTSDEDVPSEAPNWKDFEPEDEAKIKRIKDWVANHANDNPTQKSKDIEYFIHLTEPKIHPKYFDSITDGTLNDNKYLALDDGGFCRIRDIWLSGMDQLVVNYGGNGKGFFELRMDGVNGPLLTKIELPKTKGGWNFQTFIVPLKSQEDYHDLYLVYQNPQGQRSGNLGWLMPIQSLPGKENDGYQQIHTQLLSLLNAKTENTPIMLERPDYFSRTTRVFERGNWLVHGELVAPKVPNSLPAIPEKYPQNRLGLAQWMVSPENPLTARVMVNRVWEQLFGIGLIETAEDFGTQGAPPSHPQLLDHLAWKFMHEHHWSIKSLLREIVSSATYQQSSKSTPDLNRLDPYNRLLARGPRFRLSAEQVRDQALAVSGLLSEKMHGPSVMPPQPEGVWQVIYSGNRWKTDTTEDRYRRGLYTFWRRTSPYPSMTAFDSPSREFCVQRRIRTNTPLQSLVTLNDTVYFEAAQALAAKMNQQPSLDHKIITGWKKATLKPVDSTKLEYLRKFYLKAKLDIEKGNTSTSITGKYLPGNAENAALVMTASVILNLDEFLTKE